MRKSLLVTLKEASWGIAAPVIILGGLRTGAFTPTEAAVVAVFYGLFVGIVVYRTLDLRRLYRVLVDSAEISAVVMLIIACAGIFAHAGSTLGAFDALANAMLSVTREEHLMLAMIMLLLLVAGMLLDAASIFLIFLPILVPVVNAFGWDMTWFAVLMTMNMADRPVHAADGRQPAGDHPRCRDRHGEKRCNGCSGSCCRCSAPSRLWQHSLSSRSGCRACSVIDRTAVHTRTKETG